MKDLKTLAVEQHHTDQPGPIFVTLSAWNSQGRGEWFAKSLALPRKGPCVFIAQRNGNHWWHTDEIFTVAEQVRALKREGDRPLILYGSSMGGYGACHLMNLFEADLSIAVAPQVLIAPDHLPTEQRWLDERTALAQRPCFDERNSLGRAGANLLVIFDPFHAMDGAHIAQLHEANGGRSMLHLVPIPHTSHDVARVLARQGILKSFIHPALNGQAPDWAALTACALAYRRDAKSFFNYLRSTYGTLSADARSESLVLARSFLSAGIDLDFEALYMAADVFKLYRLHQDARDLMDRSVAVYEAHARRPPPAYLLKKQASVHQLTA